MYDAEKMDTIKHIHIGTGKLGLGYVLPLLQDGVDSGLMVRRVSKSQDKLNDNDLKNLHLIRNDEYTWQSSEAEDGTTRRISCNKTYCYHIESDSPIIYSEGSEGSDWDDVDIITTAVGIDKLSEIAPWIGNVLYRRMARDSHKPVVLMAFENGSRPSSNLFKMIQTKYANLTRKLDKILVCDAVVDSICRIKPWNEEDGLVAIGQSEPSLFIMACNDVAEDIIRRTFRSGDEFGRVIVRRKTPDENLNDLIFDFNEKKKAWLVNALDYIVAANRIHKNAIKMPESEDDSSFLIAKEFGNAANHVLENILITHGLDYEEYLGADSFLGTCDERVDATIKNIINNAKKNRQKRSDCFDVLKNLGVYHATSYVEDNRYTNEDPFSRCIESIDSFVTNNERVKRFMLDDPGFQEWRSGQDDDFHEWFDRQALFSFKAELHSRLIDFYMSYNLSPYLEKIRSRLLLRGKPWRTEDDMPQAMREDLFHAEDSSWRNALRVEDIHRIAPIYDGFDGRKIATILSTVDEQLDVAAEKLRETAGTISSLRFNS
jgi:hypothetical protein